MTSMFGLKFLAALSMFTFVVLPAHADWETSAPVLKTPTVVAPYYSHGAGWADHGSVLVLSRQKRLNALLAGDGQGVVVDPPMEARFIGNGQGVVVDASFARGDGQGVVVNPTLHAWANSFADHAQFVNFQPQIVNYGNAALRSSFRIE